MHGDIEQHPEDISNCSGNIGLIPLSVIEIFKKAQELTSAQSGDNSFQEVQSEHQSTGGSRHPDAGAAGVTKTSIKLWISYIEIYNENVNDLLDTNKRNLSIREDKNKEVTIENLTKVHIRNVEEIFKYLKKGNQAKMIAEHKQNEKSSRSHTIFRIEVSISEMNP